jgi:hypothetical protein
LREGREIGQFSVSLKQSFTSTSRLTVLFRGAFIITFRNRMQKMMWQSFTANREWIFRNGYNNSPTQGNRYF